MFQVKWWKRSLFYRHRRAVATWFLVSSAMVTLLMILKVNEIHVNGRHDSTYSNNSSVTEDGSKKTYLIQAEHRKTFDERGKNGKEELACQIPELDPFDQSIMHLIVEPKPQKCKGSMVTNLNQNQLVIKDILLKKTKYKQCYASTVKRKDDYLSEISAPVRIGFGAKNSKGDAPLLFNLSNDFTFVLCDEKGKNDSANVSTSVDVELLYKQDPKVFDVHVTVVPKPEVKDRARSIKPPADGLGLNVIMLGLESTSRMNFIRQLPETYKLLGKYNTIIFEGYNIVGDATTGSVIPILTGRTEMELPEVRKSKSNSEFVDTYPLIWKDFAKNGYATMFAEEWRTMPTFNFKFTGFNKQPTDHYLRNLWNAVTTKNHCLGSKPAYKVLFDYLLNYMTVYKDVPHFGFPFINGLTHENINPLKLIDSDLFQFLADAEFNGLLNNTILLMFGDHGSRYFKIRQLFQGKLEERLPFFSMTVPAWFPHKYPDLYANLRRNSQRLVTPFDFHETLKSVLHFKARPENVTQRGISIFNEIPKNRTCTDAHIDAHWCSCLAWEPANSKKKKEVADALINIINKKTEWVREKCAKLNLSLVLHGQQLVPNQKVLRFKETDRYQRVASFDNNSTVNVADLPLLFQVTVQTLPGNGLFEGTIRVIPKTTSTVLAYEVSGDISRTNKYGNQADCIRESDPHLMKFCFCKNETVRKN